MANYSFSSLFTVFLIFTILGAVAGREVPTKANATDKKQPEWFIDSDGSVLIPGIGRVQVPALTGFPHFPPNSGTGTGTGTGNNGGAGNSGTGSTGGGTPSYVPGGDDTFIPNPGVEVPIGGGGVPTPQTTRP